MARALVLVRCHPRAYAVARVLAIRVAMRVYVLCRRMVSDNVRLTTHSSGRAVRAAKFKRWAAIGSQMISVLLLVLAAFA